MRRVGILHCAALLLLGCGLISSGNDNPFLGIWRPEVQSIDQSGTPVPPRVTFTEDKRYAENGVVLGTYSYQYTPVSFTPFLSRLYALVVLRNGQRLEYDVLVTDSGSTFYVDLAFSSSDIQQAGPRPTDKIGLHGVYFRLHKG